MRKPGVETDLDDTKIIFDNRNWHFAIILTFISKVKMLSRQSDRENISLHIESPWSDAHS